MTAPLVLASASPRRHALLREAGVAFEVEPADVDETIDPATEPVAAARELAARKARAVAARPGRAGRVVLAADTVVAVPVPGGTRLLAKPEDEDEAREFLGLLSAARHQVVTGVAVAAHGDVATDAERTWVTMRRLADAEVEAYVASGEWRGKAGGYAIQENADAFVTALEEGGFDNVVGLPVARSLALLERVGWRPPA